MAFSFSGYFISNSHYLAMNLVAKAHWVTSGFGYASPLGDHHKLNSTLALLMCTHTLELKVSFSEKL